MTKKASTQMPQVELATKDWTVKELMDTERRIEKAFHEQTQFLSGKTDSIQKAFHEQTQFLTKETSELKKEIANQTRWTVGLIATMTIAIILAVLFKS